MSGDTAAPEVVDAIELPATATKLMSPEGVEVVVLGTAHVSKKSVEEAQYLTQNLKPTACFLELCSQRQGMLKMPIEVNADRAKPDSLMQALVSGNSLFQAALTSFYADVIDQLQLEVNPGAEFAATAQEAKKIMSTIYLGDRDVSITLRRAWHSLSWWQRIKLLYGFCTADVSDEDIEKLKENDVMTQLIKEAGEEFPGLLEPLLYERDRYMAFNLRMICNSMHKQAQESNDTKKLSVLAVVGLGHVKGIAEQFPKELDVFDFQNISQAPDANIKTFILQTILVPTAVCVIGVLVWKRLRR